MVMMGTSSAIYDTIYWRGKLIKRADKADDVLSVSANDVDATMDQAFRKSVFLY